MPLNYNDLTPKGKFIRTCICVPILLALLIAIPFWLSSFVQFTTGFLIKYAIIVVISVIIAVAQLIMTYKAWKDHESY